MHLFFDIFIILCLQVIDLNIRSCINGTSNVNNTLENRNSRGDVEIACVAFVAIEVFEQN